MKKANTGGAAFPSTHPHGREEGMTLRDYFAAKAMQAFLRNQPPPNVDEPYTTWAYDAYEMADAMLEARGM